MSETHTRDEHCDVDHEDLCCRVCGVDHSETCPACGGRGFHRDGCEEVPAVA